MTPAAADAKPHVLYVAWGFPPSRAGGVYRALATANGLVAAGFRVTVLTATRESFFRYTGADVSMEAAIDPAVTVVRIPFEWPALDTNIRHWSFTRAFLPRLWRRRQRAADTRDFPEPGYGPWRRSLERAALSIHRDNPVDVVVATANPNVDFMAADVLHRKFAIPYVMDYRDAWMLDVFDGSLLHPEGGEVDALERRLLASASEIWFVNEPIRAWHAQRHPMYAAKMHVVANGYDERFAPTPHLTARNPARPLKFGYVGTVSPKVPLAEFARGWSEAVRRDPVMQDATADIWGYLGYYLTPNPNLLALIEKHTDDGMRYCGPVAKEEVSSVYDDWDGCLLILGTGQFVTSGKVYEYLATALPIVSVHDRSNAATDILTGYPLWFPVADLSQDAVADALLAAAQAARTADDATRRACRDFAATFRRDHQLRPRLRALKELAGAAPSKVANP